MATDKRLAFIRLKAILEEHNADIIVEDVETVKGLSKDKKPSILWIQIYHGTQLETIQQTLDSLAAKVPLAMIIFRVGMSDYLHYVPSTETFFKFGDILISELESYQHLAKFKVMRKDLKKELTKLYAQHKRRTTKKNKI